MLKVRDLYISIKEDKIYDIVRGISFEIKPGEIYGIAGESGSGKSITALSILHLIKPPIFIRKGEIEFDGEILDNQNEEQLRKIRGRGIGFIFQEPIASLNPVFSIGNQLIEVLTLHRNITKIEAKEMAISLLREVKITEPEKRLRSYPFELSGGMAQRVGIALALAGNPKLLIADEPTTALDVTVQAEILTLLIDIKKDRNMSIMFITHDLSILYNISDRIGIMYAGKIVEEGKTETILKNPLHPYTKSLIACIPDIQNSERKLHYIKGFVPNYKEYPKGCAFYPRCEKRKDICKNITPKIINIKEEHKVACHLYA
jgi:peptide/nickel transport system ATP-binding protein/oligopeptide transport system ATP-binding protein